MENFVGNVAACAFFVVFEGFEDFFVVFVNFYLGFVRVLCEIGLLSFSIRACIGLSTCSLHEV